MPPDFRLDLPSLQRDARDLHQKVRRTTTRFVAGGRAAAATPQRSDLPPSLQPVQGAVAHALSMRSSAAGDARGLPIGMELHQGWKYGGGGHSDASAPSFASSAVNRRSAMHTGLKWQEGGTHAAGHLSSLAAAAEAAAARRGGLHTTGVVQQMQAAPAPSLGSAVWPAALGSELEDGRVQVHDFASISPKLATLVQAVRSRRSASDQELGKLLQELDGALAPCTSITGSPSDGVTTAR